jgi:hypothetical protein
LGWIPQEHAVHATRFAIPFVLLAGLAVAMEARADARQFQAVPAAPAQSVTVVGTTSVISAQGATFSGGASLQAVSGRKARLMVSFKNLGAGPVPVGIDNVQVTSGGAPLVLAAVNDGSGRGNEHESMAVSSCMSVPKDLYSSCMANAVNRVRIDPAKGGAASRQSAPDAVPLAPGKTVATQYLVDLPKKSRRQPVALTVTLRVGDERLAFDFREVE